MGIKQGELEMVNYILEHDIGMYKVAQLGKEKKGFGGGVGVGGAGAMGEPSTHSAVNSQWVTKGDTGGEGKKSD